MRLQVLPNDFSVCSISDVSEVDFSREFVFLSKTDSEISLVCDTFAAPRGALKAEHGWRGFRICGSLDFALVGILAQVSAVLAESGISIFAVSTYDTDYVLVKQISLGEALAALGGAGYEIGSES